MWMVRNEILSSYVIKRPIYQKNPKDLILIPNPDKFSQFPPQYIFTSGDTSHTTLAMCLTKENAVRMSISPSLFYFSPAWLGLSAPLPLPTLYSIGKYIHIYLCMSVVLQITI